MRKKDLLDALGKIDDKYIIEVQKYTAKTENSDGDKEENMENIVMGVEVMSKKHSWQKVSSSAAAAAAVILVVGAVAYIGKDHGFKVDSSPGTNISATESSSLTKSITVSDTQATTESVSYEPVEVGDGIYRVSSFPPFEKVTLSCEYGTAERSKGAQVRAYKKTIDFSSIPDEYNNDFLPYCVLDDEETVYFADYFNFYKSDIELNSPELLFNIGRDQEKFPATIDEMIAFDNTDLLFFNGTTINGPCVGTINPETGEADFVSCTYSMKIVPCNNGVMLYDYIEEDFAKGDYDAAAKSIYLAAYEWFGDFYNIPLITDPSTPAVDDPGTDTGEPVTDDNNTGDFMMKLITWIVIIAIVIIILSALTGGNNQPKKRAPKKVQRRGPHTSSYRRYSHPTYTQPKRTVIRVPFIGSSGRTSSTNRSSSGRSVSSRSTSGSSTRSSSTSRSSSGRSGGFGGGSTRGGGAGRRK